MARLDVNLYQLSLGCVWTMKGPCEGPQKATKSSLVITFEWIQALSCENSLYFLSKILVLHLECLAPSSGSLGLLHSTKKVIHFCNLVEARRLPKCESQGGSSITLASPLVSILVLDSIFILLPKCILVSLLLDLALVKLEYIKWY